MKMDHGLIQLEFFLSVAPCRSIVNPKAFLKHGLSKAMNKNYRLLCSFGETGFYF